MNLKQYIDGQGANDWSLSKESGSAGKLTLRFRVLKGEQDTHTETVGATISGDDYSYTLNDVSREYTPQGYDVTQTWTDGLQTLEEVPCFLRKNLPASARIATLSAARWGLTALVSCADVLEACSTAAAQAGITLDYSGVNAGNVQVPLIDNGSTIGAVLTQLYRYIPNMTTRVNGSTVSVCGGQGELTSAATRAQGVVECSPAMKTGTLTVGSTAVDLAEVYAANANSQRPLNWNANCTRLICDALVDCEEADAMAAGRYIFLAAREAGATGNDITLSLSGVSPEGTAATAKLYLPNDLTQAGSISDGVTTVELEEAVGTNATASVQLAFQQGVWPEFGLLWNDVSLINSLWEHELSAENVADWVAFLNSDAEGGLQGVAVASVDAGVLTFTAVGRYSGAAGNALQVQAYAPSPFTGSPQFSGGADGGRTVGDIVDAINDEDDFPFTASGGAIGAKASGSAEIAARTSYTGCTVAIYRAGEIVVQKGISGSFATLQALVDAINAQAAIAEHVTLSTDGQVLTVTATEEGAAGNELEFIVRWLFNPIKTYRIALAGGADAQGVVLTAKETGSNGNGIGVRADGCFGSAGQFSGGTDANEEPYSITPFSGGGGQDIRAAYEGLLGMQAREQLPENWAITHHAIESTQGNQPPTCVIGVTSSSLGGQNIAFRVPDEANEYQRGALIVDVNIERTKNAQIERESWQYDPERAKKLARQEIRNELRNMNAQREQTQPWMMVKGSPLPPGWHIASGSVNMRMPLGDKEIAVWKRFWTQFGAFKVLKEIEGIGFGTPYMFPVNAEDAYPPDEAPDFEETAPVMGKPMAPSILETSNTPANYKILAPAENVHILTEGSFPASSKAGANIGGLKFYKGCLKQYVYIKSEPSGVDKETLLDFFKGSCEIGNEILRFTCLKLEATFINRRKKRYQTGTNKLAPSDPDYNEDVDGGAGWHITGDRTEEDPEPDTGLTKTDYIEAAKAFLAACQNTGTAGKTEEITARVIDGDFDPSMSVDDVFATVGMANAASGGYTYNASTHEITARGNAGQAENLELDDFLTRRRAIKEALWLDWREQYQNVTESEPRERKEEEEEYPLEPWEIQQEKEKESYPMVSPSVNASAGVSNEAMPLNPFQVYADGEKWYINEGEIASPDGPIYCEKKEIPAGVWRAGRRFYVKAVYDRAQGKYVARYKYHDKATQDDE